MLAELNLLYLTNGLTTLMNIKSALVIPNGKTEKMKNLTLHLITQEKPGNF